MSEQRNKRYALVGTIIFAVIVLLILLFVTIRSIIPPKHENVVELDFFSQEGFFEPARLALGVEGVRTDAPAPEVPAQSAPSLQPPSQASLNDEVITQRSEETVAIAREQERKRQEEAQRQREQEAIRRAGALAANAFTSPTGTGGGHSNAAVQGGSPQGSSDSGSASGIVGGSPNLQGRFRSGDSPPPRYDINERGIVVVEITVDAAGRVIRATPGGQGTTTSNQELRAAARDAALKARFSPQEGARSQTGTITYIFNLN